MSFLGAAAFILLGVAFVHHARLMRAITRSRPSRRSSARYPSITVIRPTRGVDVDELANVEALLSLRYPGSLEILFVLDDLDDPARPLIDKALAHHAPRVDARILIADAPPPGRTGKLNAMMRGVREARGELIAFSDSDTRPGGDLLTHLADALLATPDAGDTFAPVVVSDAATRAGDVGYALLQNAWYGPSVALAARPAGELPFIMGQLMLFRREALDAIGGVGCAEGQLVDDMYIGRCMNRSGYHNIMIGEPVVISAGGQPFVEFLHNFRRWLLFSRNGLPSRFTLPSWFRGAAFWGGSIIALMAALRGDGVAFILALLVIAGTTWSQVALHRRFGGAPIAPRHVWVALALPLLAPFIALSGIVYPRVDWRGHRYVLGAHARLTR